MKNEVPEVQEGKAIELPKYVSTYQEGEKTFYRVYVNLRSRKIRRIREQERVNEIPTLKKAMDIRDDLIVELTKKISEKEAEGFTWGEIVDKFEMYWRRYPSRTFNDDTLRDHVSRMENWTGLWRKKPVKKLTIGDARDVFKMAYDRGASITLRRQIKQTINQIFKWGLEERMIIGHDRSPARDIEVLCVGETKPDEKRKEILTASQISRLLEVGLEKEHPWYPVWFVDFHAGLRNGELEGLRKEKIELVPREIARQLDLLSEGDPRRNYGFIHVELAWKQKGKKYGPTKAHYARSVPINSELYWFLVEYLPKARFGKDEYGERVFDKLHNWRNGGQAAVLRLFCEANGLPSIKFHTIRACFATQLLALGVPENVVMKVGGWKDVETMRIYVRLAGIVEHGSTEGLKFKDGARHFDPSSPYQNVDYRKATEFLEEDDEGDNDEGPEARGGVVEAKAETSQPEQAKPAEVASLLNVVSLQAFRERQVR